MKEVKDPEITLFGKKIALPENVGVILAGEDCSDDSGGGDCRGISYSSVPDYCLDAKKVNRVEESELGNEDEKNSDTLLVNKIGVVVEHCKSMPGEKEQCVVVEESRNIEAVSVYEDGPDIPPMDEDSMAKQSSDTENDQGDTNNSQQKTLKKPDKILPCPRCNSMDTKFCYYNNYNVNQPRHFCKSCQRYWTAGGTMRNVPVGAGRRKNKNSNSNCHAITISEALQATRMDAPNGFHHPNFKPNGAILSFGHEYPVCDSIASVMNLAEKKALNGCPNAYYKLDPIASVSAKGVGNGNNCSSGLSNVAVSNSAVQGVKTGPQEPLLQHMNKFLSPVPYLPGVPWPFQWNSGVPIPAICPPGYPMPIYPAPIWNCGVWSFPWLPSVSPPSQSLPDSSPNSTLGKHSRDDDLLKSRDSEGNVPQEPKTSEGSVLVPKTLRIDDPEEAAKSSIWTTLGIKYDSISKGGLFRGFQQKADEKKHLLPASPILHENPAALSRSVTFLESA